MYTKDIYRDEILKFIERKYDPVTVAKKTFTIFNEHIREIDKEFREKLLDISNMEAGPEFEMTEEEFKEFINNM